MLNLDANDVAEALPCMQLIESLRDAFRKDVGVPDRIHIDVPVAKGTPGNLLMMPAWQIGDHLGVKIATVFPDNGSRGLPAVYASYILMSAATGEPVAVLDGSELTLRRTAAASALAADYLARTDAKTLLMVGTGNLAPHLIAAHTTVRPIETVVIWGRRKEAASDLAARLSASTQDVVIATDLQEAVTQADIISCATLATEPLIKGDWLGPGQHVDLVGAFRPDMREADSSALQKASVYVDTRAGSLSEAGDIIQALQSGTFSADDIIGELSELCRGDVGGRKNDETTLFKSVGTALEDLAAANLAVKNFTAV